MCTREATSAWSCGIPGRCPVLWSSVRTEPEVLADLVSDCIHFQLAGRLCCRGDGRHPAGGAPASFVSASEWMRHEVHRNSTLEYLAVYPDGYRDGASYPLLIWLHGFGADMYDLAPLAEAVQPSGYLHVLPNAPLGGFGGPEGT